MMHVYDDSILCPTNLNIWLHNMVIATTNEQLCYVDLSCEFDNEVSHMIYPKNMIAI